MNYKSELSYIMNYLEVKYRSSKEYINSIKILNQVRNNIGYLIFLIPKEFGHIQDFPSINGASLRLSLTNIFVYIMIMLFHLYLLAEILS